MLNEKSSSYPYDQYPLHNLVMNRSLSKLLDNVELKKQCHILDIGCGTGSRTRILKERLQAHRAIGVDIDGKMIEKAKRHWKTCEFQVAQAEELPFQNETFDFVCSSFSLHHFWDPKKVLMEAKRVLKPDGQLAIIDIRGDNLLGKWSSSFEYYHGSTFSFFDSKRIIKSMNDHGFENIHFCSHNWLFFSVIIS